MADDGTPTRPDPLAALYGKLPRGWECWASAAPGGLLYARYRRSSPPIVLRAATAGALAALVEEADAGRVKRPEPGNFPALPW
jgi:hypothetical protein